MATIELTKENFEHQIESGGLVVIDFWAPWCGPCKMFGPIFEEVSESYPDVVFGKVNTEQEQELAASFGIRSIPTLMLIRDSIGLFSQAGALPKNALQEVVDKALELDMNEVRAQIAEQTAAEQKPN